MAIKAVEEWGISFVCPEKALEQSDPVSILAIIVGDKISLIHPRLAEAI